MAAAVAADAVAERLGPRLLPALPIGESEAGFKLGRLRELRRSGLAPRVLILGASPSDSCLDPAVISSRGVTIRAFNACLTGSTVPVLRRWRELWKREVAPEVVLVGAQPMMFLAAGRYSNAVSRDVAALEASYEPPPPEHPVKLWRWRRELVGALTGGHQQEVEPNSVLTEEQLFPMRRHRPDGFLEAFLDGTLVEGLQTLPEDWYAYLGIDPYAPPDVAPYLAFLDELRAEGIHPIAVIPPLHLSASPATSLGSPQAYPGADELLQTAAERSLDVVDLRPLTTGDGDFADVFHVSRTASGRVSEACGDALRRLAPKVRV